MCLLDMQGTAAYSFLQFDPRCRGVKVPMMTGFPEVFANWCMER